MKVGETIAVNIGAASVANAKIVEIDNENSLVTLVVPATKVIMSFRTELDTAPNAVSTDSNQHVMLGLENEVTPDAPVDEAALAADAPPTEPPAETPVESPVEDVAPPAPVEEKPVEND